MRNEINTITKEDLFSAMVKGDFELARKTLSEALLPRGDDPKYPHGREYYEDLVEVLMEGFRTDEDPLYETILIDDVPYEWNTTEEMNLLAWVRQLVQRGWSFEEAFGEARELIIELTDMRHERIVYDLEEDDRFPVTVWEERLTERGVELSKAQVMAREIVRLLQQMYLVETDEVIAEEAFSEHELKKRQVLLERLNMEEESASTPVGHSLATARA